MLLVNNKVYVANAGGWGSDNTIDVIDISSDAVTSTITVGDNPNSLVIDASGSIWVTSGGATAYNEDWSINEETMSLRRLTVSPKFHSALRLSTLMRHVERTGVAAFGPRM